MSDIQYYTQNGQKIVYKDNALFTATAWSSDSQFMNVVVENGNIVKTKRLFKITIPNALKLGITKLLSQMNISSETLFPVISGLSQSLNRLRDGYCEYLE